ncbi:MAG: DsrE/DsrF/DrsH-like family protein [Candidatus Kariarchaeaceae archaeon]|jgi:peroxiredoxin family protein
MSDKPKRMAIIAANGSLDAAYPPVILASTAAAMDMEVAIFFTFYGFDLIHKKRSKKLKVSPIGNAAAPKAFGLFHPPNIMSILPGMTRMATWMMKSWMKGANVAKFIELRDACLELGVRFIACTMTMSVMGIEEKDLIDGCEQGGAAMFLEFAQDADITLMM